MFLLLPQVSRNWRYESEPPLKPSPLTCRTNSIIMLMFVEPQRVHIQSTCKVCNKNLEFCSIKWKTHIFLSQVYCVWQVVKTPTIIRITLYSLRNTISLRELWLCILVSAFTQRCNKMSTFFNHSNCMCKWMKLTRLKTGGYIQRHDANIRNRSHITGVTVTKPT